ncbi:MAG: DJ-1/PfpI family protein [Lachnospiraceae bacterium]|nr:DJ-1/PfpI family protein [Lachnospiraceae bacterium]
MSKVAVFLAEGFEEIEALTVSDILRRAKVDVENVSISDDRYVTGSHGIKVQADKVFSEVDFDSLEVIVLPGGMPGSLNLEAFDPLMDRVDEFIEKDKYVAAICAAPQILGHKEVLAGKRACCSSGFEGELKGAEVTYERVEKSGNIITSRGMGTAIDFALCIAEIYIGKEAAEALSKKIAYK